MFKFADKFMRRGLKVNSDSFFLAHFDPNMIFSIFSRLFISFQIHWIQMCANYSQGDTVGFLNHGYDFLVSFMLHIGFIDFYDSIADFQPSHIGQTTTAQGRYNLKTLINPHAVEKDL